MTTLLKPEDLGVGDRFIESRYERGEMREIVIEIIGAREPHTDRFGREQFKYMARREDTGKTGYMIYGFGAESLRPAPPISH